MVNQANLNRLGVEYCLSPNGDTYVRLRMDAN